MGWFIERAKIGSVCHVCQAWIPRKQYRFGNWDLDRWYHLDCAVERNPRSFEPFAEQAAKLLAAPSAPDEPAEYPRNPELEARLVASPDDDALRAVYADWLQSVGDPWGDLIALELAHKDARTILRDNVDTLIGSFPPRMFDWRRGFIDKISLDVVAPPAAADILVGAFGLRTTLLVRELYLPLYAATVVTEINACAPRTIRHISTWFSSALDRLALPNLERLTLFGYRFALPDFRTFLDTPFVQSLATLEIARDILDDSTREEIARRTDLAAKIRML